MGVRILLGAPFAESGSDGRALGLGPRGRRFKSCLSDHYLKNVNVVNVLTKNIRPNFNFISTRQLLQSKNLPKLDIALNKIKITTKFRFKKITGTKFN